MNATGPGHRGLVAVIGPTPLPLDYATRTPGEPHDPEDHDLAVASLFCGLIICAPVISGLMSVIFGVAVLRRASRLRRLDLALASLGTAVGAVQTSLWILFLALG